MSIRRWAVSIPARPRARWWALAVWIAAVLALSLLPGAYVPRVRVEWISASAHIVMYAIMAALALRAAEWPCPTCGVVVTVACGALGAVLEVVQELVPGRYGDPLDALANIIGAAVASFVWLALAMRTRRLAGGGPGGGASSPDD